MPKPIPTIFFLLILVLSSTLQIQSANFSDDYEALLAFKSAVHSSSIPPTSCLDTWNFSSDPCAVPRVYFTCAVTCTAKRVVQITLDSKGYTGMLIPNISLLTQLITLDLGDNNFSGQIPSSISSLPNLTNLILRANSFSGSVPSSIANLRSLVTLDLSKNSLSGVLPNLNKLVQLTNLDLSYNNLTGLIPQLPPNLIMLTLKANSLSGSLTRSVFAGLTLLTTVELSENSLAGILEPWFFLLPSLQQVELAKNNFTGIAVAKPPASELVAVNLSYNIIEGFLPVNLTEYPRLGSLSLSYNLFRGGIPSQYSKNGSSPLRRLYLDGNFLNGLPPDEFFSGNWTGSLGDNCLDKCPAKSELCLKPQKNVSTCRQFYSGKPRS